MVYNNYIIYRKDLIKMSEENKTLIEQIESLTHDSNDEVVDVLDRFKEIISKLLAAAQA